MKKGQSSSGYTIVELMVVLAVTSALLVSGLLLVSNQQAKTELKTYSDTLKGQIDQVINNVAAGYYKNTTNFQCTASPTQPSLAAAATNSQGTNSECIFLGKAIQFGVGSDKTKLNVYTLAGLRLANGVGPSESDSIDKAKPVAVAQSSLNNVPALNDSIESINLNYNFKVKAVKYNDPPMTNSSVIGFLTSFAGLDANSNLNSGSRTSNLYAITGTSLSSNKSAFDAASLINSANFTPSVPMPGNVTGATVCFSTGVNKFVILTIGSNGRQLSTDMKIKDNTPVPTECN